MERLKRVGKFLSSMKFALLLLFVLAAACTGGSFITQGQSYEWYAQAYSPKAAAAITLLGLDDVFHSWWFVLLSAFLCLNLLLCNVLRFPALLKRWKREFLPERAAGRAGAVTGTFRTREEVLQVFHKMGFMRTEKLPAQDGGGDGYYAVKHKAGVWGAWVCHLGILLLLLGFGLGQMFKSEYTLYGVPGQSRQIGDTGYVLTIDDFEVRVREDDTVEQYTASLTVRKVKEGISQSAKASVNHPARMFGMKFYQNSTGWAADISVEKDGKEIQRETVCAGEYLEVEDKPGLVVMLSAFYPELAFDEAGKPYSAGSAPVAPGYLYRCYYQNQVIGMNVLKGDEPITIDEYTVRFSDPQPYTLIAVRRDPFTILALIGGLVILAGLFLAFYLQPAVLWAAEREDGSWTVTGQSKKGGSLFDGRLKEAVEAVSGQGM